MSKVKVILSLDEQLVVCARKCAKASGMTLNQLIREYLQKLADADDVERDIEELRRLSGRGNSQGWRFNRDELHERK